MNDVIERTITNEIEKLVVSVGGHIAKAKHKQGNSILDLCCVGHAQHVADIVNRSIGFSARVRGRYIWIIIPQYA